MKLELRVTIETSDLAKAIQGAIKLLEGATGKNAWSNGKQVMVLDRAEGENVLAALRLAKEEVDTGSDDL